MKLRSVKKIILVKNPKTIRRFRNGCFGPGRRKFKYTFWSTAYYFLRLLQFTYACHLLNNLCVISLQAILLVKYPGNLDFKTKL